MRLKKISLLLVLLVVIVVVAIAAAFVPSASAASSASGIAEEDDEEVQVRYDDSSSRSQAARARHPPLHVPRTAAEEEEEQQEEDDEDEEDERTTKKMPAATENNNNDEPFKIIPKPAPRPRLFSFDKYQLSDFAGEVVILVLLGLYGIVYWQGRNKNVELVKAWMRVNKDLYRRNFAELSDKAAGGGDVVQETNSEFYFYASGRIHCSSYLASIQLQKRHDLVSFATNLVSPSVDRIKIEIQMNDKDMEPFVLAVVQKKRLNAFRKDVYDLTTFTKPLSENFGLPDSLVVLTDCPEAASVLLDRKMVQTIQQNLRYFESLHFSDQPQVRPVFTKDVTTVAKTKKLLFQFVLPTSAEGIQSCKPLYDMTVHTIDVVARMILSREATAHVQKLRSQAESVLLKETRAQRQEEIQQELQQKKIDRLREEKRRVLSLSPEEQRKFDEKNYQKELRKRMNKAKIVIK